MGTEWFVGAVSGGSAAHFLCSTSPQGDPFLAVRFLTYGLLNSKGPKAGQETPGAPLSRVLDR